MTPRSKMPATERAQPLPGRGRECGVDEQVGPAHATMAQRWPALKTSTTMDVATNRAPSMGGEQVASTRRPPSTP
jgi:hypothetical protein